MKKIILDTNFILTCVKQKIDFFYDLKSMGFDIIIPLEIIKELDKISKSEKKLYFRENAEFAIRLLKKNKFEKIKLERKNVDDGIIYFLKKHEDIFIATLDREIKNKTKNSKVIIKGKKRLEII